VQSNLLIKAYSFILVAFDVLRVSQANQRPDLTLELNIQIKKFSIISPQNFEKIVRDYHLAVVERCPCPYKSRGHAGSNFISNMAFKLDRPLTKDWTVIFFGYTVSGLVIYIYIYSKTTTLS
jgi:hypothetical protein